MVSFEKWMHWGLYQFGEYVYIISFIIETPYQLPSFMSFNHNNYQLENNQNLLMSSCSLISHGPTEDIYISLLLRLSTPLQLLALLCDMYGFFPSFNTSLTGAYSGLFVSENCKYNIFDKTSSPLEG